METTKSLRQNRSDKSPTPFRSGPWTQSLAKTVLISADDTLYLCVTPAHSRIDMEILSWLLGADEIHLATEQEIIDLFPDTPTEPDALLDIIFGLPSVIDKQISKSCQLILKDLPNRKPVRIDLADFEKMTNPQVLDFCV